MLLRILLDDTDSAMLIYIIGGAISIFITYFFFRWIFAIDKRLKQNETVIDLLKLIAKKEGISDEEIHRATIH